MLDSICKAKEEKKQNELKTLVSAFTEFYKQVYKVNDFSFASIASENTKDTKKRSSNKRFTNSQKFQVLNDMLLNIFLFVGVIWVLIQIIKDTKDFLKNL